MSDSGKRPHSGRSRSIWPVAIGLPLIVVIAAAAIYLSSAQGDNGTPSSGGVQAQPAKKTSCSVRGSSPGALGAPELGRADAPVVMQEFGDFQ